MNRLLSSLVLASVAAGSYFADADAMSITITVDNPERIVVRDPANNYSAVEFDSQNRAVVEVEDYAPNISANSGFQINAVSNQEGNSVTYYNLPATYAEIATTLIADGDVVTITTAEKEAINFTIIAEHPEHVSSVNYLYEDYELTDGKWLVPITDPYSSVFINLESGYKLDSLTDQNGNVINCYSNIYIYPGSYTSSTTFYLKTKDLSESRTAKLNVKVVGNVEDVKLQRSDYSQVELTENEQTVMFDPDNESSFTISHSNYSKKLYKVELNGFDQFESYGSYNIYANDGDNLTITVDFPNVDVPVGISFAKEGIEGCIQDVLLNGERVEENVWKSANFTVKAGSVLGFNTNYNSYTNINFTANGQFANSPMTVPAVERFDIVVNADKLEEKEITVVCADWEHLKLGNYGDTFEVTGEETVITLGAYASSLSISGKDDYFVTGVYDYDTNEKLNFEWGSLQNVYNGMKIIVELEKYRRDNVVSLYIGEGPWAYLYMTFGQGDLAKDVLLQEGYQLVNYNDNDRPFRINAYYGPDYDTAVCYINGEKAEYNYGAYLGMESLENNSVVRFYGKEQQPLTLTYEIGEGVEPVIVHDLITEVASPAVHSVLPGTLVNISGTGLAVTVNGTAAEADEEGNFAVTVGADTTIAISKGNSVGIGAVGAESVNDIYNLQGILVKAGATAEDVKALPAGVYISGGKKIVVK